MTMFEALPLLNDPLLILLAVAITRVESYINAYIKLDRYHLEKRERRPRRRKKPRKDSD